MNKSTLKAFLAILAVGMIFILFRPSPVKVSATLDEEEETHVVTPYLEADALPAKPAALPIQTSVDPVTSSETFRRWQNLLPKTNALRFENHVQAQHLHPAILNAGRALGELKELWLKDPKKRAMAFELYQQCTLDGAVVESVRALCYVNALEVSIYLKKTDLVLAWNVDPAVQSLAARWMDN
jgi:hypothetical protein